MRAIDCAMHVEMRVENVMDPTTTFMHQMIPHHKNAVRMAKILLKHHKSAIKCGTKYNGRMLAAINCFDDDSTEATPVISMLWNIINTQNSQITFMRAWLQDNKRPKFASCNHKSDSPEPSTLSGGTIAAIVLAFLILLAGLGSGGFWWWTNNVKVEENVKDDSKTPEKETPEKDEIIQLA
jgi:hypothetical protein